MNKQEWDNSLLEHFAPKEGGLNLDLLMEMVAEVMETPVAAPENVLAEELPPSAMTLNWNSIPNIPVSEIGWSAMETRDGVEVPSAQRSQLAQFLSGIERGKDLSAKLEALSNFYKMDESVMASFEGGDMKQNIAKAMAYLVFFKTLTQILTQFNASSAGFSFESFLGVLLGGKQVPTGEGTIADLTDETGVPISLKLYKEGNLEVGGSFTDLSRDLRKPEFKNTMQYIAVTKTLSGEGMEQQGTLDWYRFNFNLENVYNIIAKSSKESRKNILLPKVFIATNGESVEGVPEKAASIPSAEEMENEFYDILTSIIAENEEIISQQSGGNFNLEDLKQSLDFAKSETLFVGNKIRGKDNMAVKGLVQSLKASALDTELSRDQVKDTAIYKAIVKAYGILAGRYKRDEQKARRQETLNEMYFYDGLSEEELLERSMTFYNAASPELKIRCLEYAYGYISNGHFNLTQGMVQKIAVLAGDRAAQLFPEGQSQVRIGQLEIGASNIQQVLNGLSGVLNQNIFQIFESLKVLTTNIQGYFAGGLSDDSKAKTAITAAEEIETKTADIADVEK